MGWTSYHATNYKNGRIDRKAECDAYFMEGLNKGNYNVKKSAMVGSVYYAAIETLKRYAGKDENGDPIREDIPENERKTWGAVFLTSTDSKDYYNFAYKDMSEDMKPFYYDCPVSILKLLSPTDNETANTWRAACYENAEKVKAKRIDPHSLNNLPVGSSITFPCPFNSNMGVKIGDKVVLSKIQYRGKPIWFDGVYRWKKPLIPEDYEVLSA